MQVRYQTAPHPGDGAGTYFKAEELSTIFFILSPSSAVAL